MLSEQNVHTILIVQSMAMAVAGIALGLSIVFLISHLFSTPKAAN